MVLCLSLREVVVSLTFVMAHAVAAVGRIVGFYLNFGS